MNALLNQVNASVQKGTVADQTETKPQFERTTVPEGQYPARFVGYIEVGDRDGGEWKGQPKPPVRHAYAFFELLSKKLAQEIEVEEGGKKIKKTTYPTIRVRLEVKVGEKANITKLFKQMAAGRPLTHIAQMLTEPFRVRVSHYVKDKGTANERVYENLKDDSGWLVFPPTIEQVDDEGNMTTKALNVQPQTQPLRLLLWDDPQPEQWESIAMRAFDYKDAAGKEQSYPGGYYQYVCVHEALDFKGSALEAMLAGGALGDLTEATDDLTDDISDALDSTQTNSAASSGDEDLGLDDLDDLE